MLYSKTLSRSDINLYIDGLINQIFSILPLFEEQGRSEELVSKIHNLIYRIDGFLLMSNYDTYTAIDILSLCNSLKHQNTHHSIRSIILKLCSLLSKIKEGGCYGS